MMFSICIPVYNFEVKNLVLSLKKEIKYREINAEIILIDDFSEEYFCKKNKEIANQVDEFIFLKKNIGRSQIRNIFLSYTKGNFLLFLDCDGKIISDKFLLNYKNFISENKNFSVVYGGRKVSENKPTNEYLLRWKFANERENLPLKDRQEKPYLSFQTNNFLIKKEIFAKNLFNENLKQYGYEDLLFAMDLKEKKVSINHINNPIFNNDVETNVVYLKKVEESVETLVYLLKTERKIEKLNEIKLVSAYLKLKKLGLIFIFEKIFDRKKIGLKRTLLSGNANLRILDFYKLGLFTKCINQKTN